MYYTIFTTSHGHQFRLAFVSSSKGFTNFAWTIFILLCTYLLSFVPIASNYAAANSVVSQSEENEKISQIDFETGQRHQLNKSQNSHFSTNSLATQSIVRSLWRLFIFVCIKPFVHTRSSLKVLCLRCFVVSGRPLFAYFFHSRCSLFVSSLCVSVYLNGA